MAGLYCPNCGTALLSSVLPIWTFPIVHCSSCSFVGNELLTHVVDSTLTYEQRAETQTNSHELLAFRYTMRSQATLRQFLKESKQEILRDPYKAQDILNKHGIVFVECNERILTPFYLASKSLQTIYHLMGVPNRTSVVIPFFVAPHMISCLLFLFNEGLKWIYPVELDETARIKEGGLGLLSDGSHLIATTDFELAAQLFKKQLTSPVGSEYSIGIFNPNTSVACWRGFNYDSVTILVTDEVPTVLYDARSLGKRLTVARVSKEDIIHNSSLLSINKIMSDLVLRAQPWAQFIRDYLLSDLPFSSVQQATSRFGIIDRESIVREATNEETARQLRGVLDIDTSQNEIEWDGHMYTRHPDGGLSKTPHRGHRPVLISTADLRISQIVDSGTKTYIKGVLRYCARSLDFMVDLSTIESAGGIKRWVRGLCMSHGLAQPILSENKATLWLDVCTAMSSPSVAVGSDTVGFLSELDVFVYPGIVVTPDQVLKESLLLTTCTTSDLKLPRNRKQLSIALSNMVENDEHNAICWATFIGLASVLLHTLYDMPKSGLIVLGSEQSFAHTLVDGFSKAFLALEKPVIDGYIHCDTTIHPYLLARTTPVEAYCRSLTYPFYFVTATTKKKLVDFSPFVDTMLHFTQYAFSQERKAGYKHVAEHLYLFLCELLQKKVPVIEAACRKLFFCSPTASNMSGMLPYADRLLALVHYLDHINLLPVGILSLCGTTHVLDVHKLVSTLSKTYKFLRNDVNSDVLIDSLYCEGAIQESLGAGTVALTNEYWECTKREWTTTESAVCTAEYR